MRFAEFQPRLLFLFSMRRRNWLLYLTKEFKKKRKKKPAHWYDTDLGGKEYGLMNEAYDNRLKRTISYLYDLIPKTETFAIFWKKKKRPFNLWCPRLCMLIVTNIINRSICNIQLLTNQPWKRTTIFVLSFQIRVIFFSSAWDQFSSKIYKGSLEWVMVSTFSLYVKSNCK